MILIHDNWVDVRNLQDVSNVIRENYNDSLACKDSELDCKDEEIHKLEDRIRELESGLQMCNCKEILSELREDYDKCNELFDIAYELNDSENTRTAFTQKVTTYIPNVLQTIGYLISKLEEECK